MESKKDDSCGIQKSSFNDCVVFFPVSTFWGTDQALIDFLSSQRFSQKLDLLQDSIGDVLYKEVKEINEFRNFIAHGTYGEEVLVTEVVPLVPSGRMSVTKLGRGGKRYSSRDLNLGILDEHIERERKILKAMHELTLKRLPAPPLQTPKNESDPSASKESGKSL